MWKWVNHWEFYKIIFGGFYSFGSSFATPSGKYILAKRKTKIFKTIEVLKKPNYS